MQSGLGEGVVFSVPIQSGGYCMGVVARISKGRGAKSILGYFFSPRHQLIPNLDALESLRADRAILIAILGDLGFYEGHWSILGSLEEFDRAKWPMPEFGSVLPGGLNPRRITYDPDNPDICLQENPCTLEEVVQLPRNGLFGAGAIELVLDRILNEGSTGAEA